MFEITDPRFNVRADAHIELSNQQCRDASADKVSLSLLDASSRFNVWLWAITSKDAAEFRDKRAQALEVLQAETLKRFNKHFDEYAANYEAYIVAPRDAADKAQPS